MPFIEYAKCDVCNAVRLRSRHKAERNLSDKQFVGPGESLMYAEITAQRLTPVYGNRQISVRTYHQGVRQFPHHANRKPQNLS